MGKEETHSTYKLNNLWLISLKCEKWNSRIVISLDLLQKKNNNTVRIRGKKSLSSSKNTI